jgi:hypothetical protein
MWDISKQCNEKKKMCVSTVIIALILSMLLRNGTVRAEDNNSYQVSLYDYDSNQLLTSLVVSFTTPDNKYETDFTITFDSTVYFLSLTTTNAQIANLWIDMDNRRVYVGVGGETGRSGDLELLVPPELLPSPGDVKVDVDNRPIEFTVENRVYNGKLWYVVHAEYTLSTHILMVDFGLRPTNSTPTWNIVAIGGVLAVIAVLGAVYWLKFRR